MRRINLSPSPSHRRSDSDYDDSYDDDNSIDEVEATLNNLDSELDDTEQALSSWSSTGTPRTFTSSSFTGSPYTGSPSYVTLPAFNTRSPPPAGDPRFRLSRVTERTEEGTQSRPVSGISAADTRLATPDPLRRSAFLSGTASPAHSRASSDSGPARELPPPGRANQLIAVFETNSPTPGTGHARAASTPAGPRSISPYYTASTNLNSGTGPSGTYSRPSSPSKSSSTGFTPTTTMSTLLSPPYYTSTMSGARPSTADGGSSFTPSTFTTMTGQTPGQTTSTFTGTSTTPTRTPTSTLRRPQTSPRSPLASVRNIVALWKERTPTRSPAKSATTASAGSVSPPPQQTSEAVPQGLFGIRRSASARLRAQRAAEGGQEGVEPLEPTPSGQSPLRPGSDVSELGRFVGDTGEAVSVMLFSRLSC